MHYAELAATRAGKRPLQCSTEQEEAEPSQLPHAWIRVSAISDLPDAQSAVRETQMASGTSNTAMAHLMPGGRGAASGRG